MANHNYNWREVASGLGFLEGPVAFDDGSVAVLDMSSSSVTRIDPASGNTQTLAVTGGAPNGAALGPDGALYICNNGGLEVEKTPEGENLPKLGGTPANPCTPSIQRIDEDGSVTELYSRCGDHALEAPNDIVFDEQGGFYFTDLGHFHGRTCNLGGIYYARPDGSSIVEVLHEANLLAPPTQPNGIGLSPAGDRLYVSETITGRVWEWAVEAPGVLGPVAEPMAENGAGLLYASEGFALFDSMAVDGEGHVCVATIAKGGITVIRPDGGSAEFIPLPQYDAMVTNICFGGPDLRTAYVTSAGAGKVWALDWPRPGLRLHFAK